MKIARIAAVLTLAGVLAAPAIQAQQGPPPGRRGPGMTGPRHGPGAGGGIRVALDHRGELGLTDAQVEELEALAAEARELRAARAEELRTLREEAAGDRSVLRERLREWREAALDRQASHRERVEGILTAEQLDGLRELVPRGRPGRGGAGARPRGGGRRGGPPGGAASGGRVG